MSEELPHDLVHFCVPSVPKFYEFGREETDEEKSTRESFFTQSERAALARGDSETDENACPGGVEPLFKRPELPAPRQQQLAASAASAAQPTVGDAASASNSATSTHTALPADEPNLVDLAAFRPPRAPLRRSQLNAPANQTTSQDNSRTRATTTAAASQQQQQLRNSQPTQLSAGAAAAARAAERRRSASSTGRSSAHEPDRVSRNTAAAASAPRSALPAVPRFGRANSISRPAPATATTAEGVTTRAMAAAAAAAAGSDETAAAPAADATVDAVTAGVAGIAVGGVQRGVSTATATQPQRVGSIRRPSAAAASADRLSRPLARRSNTTIAAAAARQVSSAIRPTRPSAAGAARAAPATSTRVTGPVRVAATLRSADSFLSAVPRTQNAFDAPLNRRASSRSTPRTDAAAATAAHAAATASPSRPPHVVTRPGSAVVVAPARAIGSATRRPPTPQSLAHLSAPRVNRGGASTPQRPFVSGLRSYRPDNRPVSTITIPDTPHFRVDRRSTSRQPPAAPVASAAAPAPLQVPRPPVNVGSMVNRLSQPRTRVTPVVPVGRSHGMPAVCRQTTTTLARSRSSSASRAAATSGSGVVQGARALIGAADAAAAPAAETGEVAAIVVSDQ